jgi:hypothetical protein
MIRGVGLGFLGAAVAAGVLAASPVASGGGARAAACPTAGLRVSGAHGSGYRVVSLTASGFSCSAARGIARDLAESLLKTGSVHVSDGSLAMSSETCTGCVPRTQISITYPKGTISVALTGSSSSSRSLLPGSIPTVPLQPAPGPGSAID